MAKSSQRPDSLALAHILGVATVAPLVYFALAGRPKEHAVHETVVMLAIAVFVPAIVDFGVALTLLRGKDIFYYVVESLLGVLAGVPAVYVVSCGSFLLTGAVAFVLGLRAFLRAGSLDRLSKVRASAAVGGAICILGIGVVASIR
jgi:hypothetical protein